MSTFNVIDVETANAYQSSICQIGLVGVKDGQIKREWQTLVNPKVEFDPYMVGIHGIRKTDVSDSPTLPEIYGTLKGWMESTIVLSHGWFDKTAINAALSLWGLPQMQVLWADSSKIARNAWPEQFATRGYNLKNVTEKLGIDFENHHEALADAVAAAKVVLRACSELCLDQDGILELSERPIPRQKSSQKQKGDLARSRASYFEKMFEKNIRIKGRADGPLHGECVVFTGMLSRPRTEIAEAVAELGCDVVPGVTKAVTMLVVGGYAPGLLKGHKRSSKHRRAISMIEKGAGIKILTENDLNALLKTAKNSERRTNV